MTRMLPVGIFKSVKASIDASDLTKRVDLLRSNFRRPSKVWVKPAIEVPTAEKRVPMTPKMALRRPWKRPMMPLKAEAMALRMEEMKLVRESMTEGIA